MTKQEKLDMAVQALVEAPNQLLWLKKGLALRSQVCRKLDMPKIPIEADSNINWVDNAMLIEKGTTTLDEVVQYVKKEVGNV